MEKEGIKREEKTGSKEDREKGWTMVEGKWTNRKRWR